MNRGLGIALEQATVAKKWYQSRKGRETRRESQATPVVHKLNGVA